jgi:F-type H+-transporting ATPase subunit delta
VKISKRAKREGKALFRACLVNGLLDELRVRQTVNAVIQARPRNYLAILRHLQRLVKFDLERRTARLESAAPLPQDLENVVQAGLLRHYGPGLNVSFAQNPALLGGLRIKVASDVYDGSIQARLAALQECF